MAVQIKDLRLNAQTDQPGLLFSFTQSHLCEISLAIGMSAQLQPTPEFAVLGQQDALAVSADQPCGAGEMAGEMMPLEHGAS